MITSFLLCMQVAKNVSLRLYTELEAVQKKNSQLEWENEALREKTQKLEVAKQVLQTEVEKAREVRILHLGLHQLIVSSNDCYITMQFP